MRVYGLQLSLKMHRYKYREEEQVIKQFALEDTFEMLDETIKDYKPTLMSFIGSKDGQCETLDIFNKGAVNHIWVTSDGSGIRTLEVNLTDGETYSYGKQLTVADADIDDLNVYEFPFEQGK